MKQDKYATGAEVHPWVRGSTLRALDLTAAHYSAVTGEKRSRTDIAQSVLNRWAAAQPTPEDDEDEDEDEDSANT